LNDKYHFLLEVIQGFDEVSGEDVVEEGDQ